MNETTRSETHNTFRACQLFLFILACIEVDRQHKAVEQQMSRIISIIERREASPDDIMRAVTSQQQYWDSKSACSPSRWSPRTGGKRWRASCPLGRWRRLRPPPPPKGASRGYLEDRRTIIL